MIIEINEGLTEDFELKFEDKLLKIMVYTNMVKS